LRTVHSGFETITQLFTRATKSLTISFIDIIVYILRVD
jgi:hypothetical protein